jgi:hypothetical protein
MHDATSAPPRPNPMLMNLSRIGWLHGIHLQQRQTGTDSADTFCVITGSDGKVEGLWSSYSQYLEVRPDHNSIARISERWRKLIEVWDEYAKREQHDLAEYERLKRKFG